jgi:hypothetical protein
MVTVTCVVVSETSGFTFFCPESSRQEKQHMVIAIILFMVFLS